SKLSFKEARDLNNFQVEALQDDEVQELFKAEKVNIELVQFPWLQNCIKRKSCDINSLKNALSDSTIGGMIANKHIQQYFILGKVDVSLLYESPGKCNWTILSRILLSNWSYEIFSDNIKFNTLIKMNSEVEAYLAWKLYYFAGIHPEHYLSLSKRERLMQELKYSSTNADNINISDLVSGKMKNHSLFREKYEILEAAIRTHGAMCAAAKIITYAKFIGKVIEQGLGEKNKPQEISVPVKIFRDFGVTNITKLPQDILCTIISFLGEKKAFDELPKNENFIKAQAILKRIAIQQSMKITKNRKDNTKQSFCTIS
ncbi:MAG: hypothetical protein VX335_02880, partial [Pseudomonadota bacterium]|nr:hypothetical protein [Pseudomonadota bacterium]